MYLQYKDSAAVDGQRIRIPGNHVCKAIIGGLGGPEKRRERDKEAEEAHRKGISQRKLFCCILKMSASDISYIALLEAESNSSIAARRHASPRRADGLAI